MIRRVLAVLAVAGALVGADEPSLSGRVVDADTGAGVPRIAVRMVPDDAEAQTVIALTDRDGRYRISDLPARSYRFELRQGSTVIHHETIVISGAQTKDVALTAK